MPVAPSSQLPHKEPERPGVFTNTRIAESHPGIQGVEGPDEERGIFLRVEVVGGVRAK